MPVGTGTSTSSRTRLRAIRVPRLRFNLGEVVAIDGSRLECLAARDGSAAGALVHTVCNGRGHYVYANSKGKRQSIFVASRIEWPQSLPLGLGLLEQQMFNNYLQ